MSRWPIPGLALSGSLALALLSVAGPAASAPGEPADVCLEVVAGVLIEAELDALESAVGSAVSARTALFPQPTMDRESPGRIDVRAGHAGTGGGIAAACLEPGHQWTARFDRAFLEAGADRMLAEAPTTPGIASSVDLEWFPAEARLRTTLVFAGPLDIPNGTCWIDDALTVDAESGTVIASGEQGVETSLFAEGACRRFFDHLPDGGAGEQAVTLLPASVELGDGTQLRFVARSVSMGADEIVVSGDLERG